MSNKYQEDLDIVKAHRHFIGKFDDEEEYEKALVNLQELIDKWEKLVEKCEENNYYMDFEYDFLKELINGK